MRWIIALSIFIVTYLFLFSENYDRTIVALAGSVIMVLSGIGLNFLSQQQAFQAINFETLMLVLGMMIMVGTVEETGLISYLAIKIAKKSEGRTWQLLIFLGAFTAISSAFVDNVTTMILIAPITLSITDLLDINPIPFLITESILSIVGGLSTMIGAPPNIIIGSTSQLGFNQMLIHLAPIALLVWVATVIHVKFRFSGFSESGEKESSSERVEDLNAERAIDDRKNAKRSVFIFLSVLVLYILHGFLGLEPSTVAFIGATLTLLVIQPDVKKILSEVKWDVLLFYAALFVLVGGLEHVGVVKFVASGFGSFASSHPMLAPLVLVWVVGILSGIIDNVPMTIAILPIILNLPLHGITDINTFWWALALGAVLGGISTPVGSSANVVTVSVSEDTKNPITFRKWLSVGIPVAFQNLCIASLLLYLGMLQGFM